MAELVVVPVFCKLTRINRTVIIWQIFY